MLKFLFSLLYLSLFALHGFCQPGANGKLILGSVADSATGYTLAGVTVAAYYEKDSTVIDAQLTDNGGNFLLDKIPLTENVYVSVSFIGYSVFLKKIIADTTLLKINLGTIKLSRQFLELDEVIVVAAPPVRMKGDTLEINPAAFRLGPNAVIEDVLKNVKGIIIWGDGTITVNGKKIDNVYVDGKPFVASSPRIATQNLPKDIVERVQIYQEGNSVGSGNGFGISNSLLTMNIQLKEDRKTGYIGKLGAGMGTTKKCELEMANILFTKRSRYALVANTNNINKIISSVTTALENSTFKNSNPDLSNAPDFDMNGISASRFAGATFEHRFNSKRRVLLNNDFTTEFSGRSNSTYTNIQTVQSTRAGEVDQLNTSQANTENKTRINFGKFGYNRKSQNNSLLLSATWNDALQNFNGQDISEVASNAAVRSHSTLTNTSEVKDTKITLNGQYSNTDARTLGLKSFFTSFDLFYSARDLNSVRMGEFNSFSSDVPSLFFNRKYQTQTDIAGSNHYFVYSGFKRLLFGARSVQGLDLRVTNQFKILNEQLKSLVQDFDTISTIYHYNNQLSYSNKSVIITEMPVFNINQSFIKRLAGRYTKKFIIDMKMKENFTTLNNSSSIEQRNVNRQFAFFEPDFGMSYEIINNIHLLNMGINHSLSHVIPQVDQLFPVVDDMNQYNIRYGNPYLGTEEIHSNQLTIKYTKIKRESNNSLNISLLSIYANSRNAISDSILFDDSGRRIAYPINVLFKKSFRSNLSVNYSTKLWKHLFQIAYLGTYNNTNIPGYINQEYLVSNYLNFNNRLNVTYAISNLFTAEILQSTSFNRYIIGSDAKAQRNNVYTTGFNLNCNVTSKIMFSNSMSYINSPTHNIHFTLWNMYGAYRFLKSEQAEIKLSAFDILRNYKNLTTSVGQNSNITIIGQSLQQFFMLSLSYYPKWFGGKSN